MQELEKILKEIDCRFENLLITDDECRKTALSKHDYEKAKYYRTGIVFTERAMDIVKDIIRKHMNDGWIPVDERLPTMEEYQKDDGRAILDDGNRRYAGYFDVYTGKFYRYRHVTAYRAELYEDNGVIAWRPLPEPYHPERSDNNDGE